MRILGIDPGSKRCGWAVIDSKTSKVLEGGHDTLDTLRDIISVNTWLIDAIAIEGIVRYNKSNSIDVFKTAFTIGRLYEIIDSSTVMYIQKELTRPEIIKILTGNRPSRNHRISKANMQDIVKKILKSSEVVRPQHKNDAVAVAIACFLDEFNNGKIKQKTSTKKETKRRRP